MKSIFVRIRKTWFEVRIFISLSIVTVISTISFLSFNNYPSSIEIAGGWFGLSTGLSIRYGYLFVAFLVLLA
jgi:hypothetical protein